MRSRLREIITQREIEENRRIRQEEIVEATGLNPNTISRWMSPKGFARIEGDVVTALMRYLGCEIGDLIYIDYDPPAKT